MESRRGTTIALNHVGSKFGSWLYCCGDDDTIGRDDFEIIGASHVYCETDIASCTGTGFPDANPNTGRFDYQVTIPAGELYALVDVVAFDDNVVEGLEFLNAILWPNASSNPAYTNSAVLNGVVPGILETDTAELGSLLQNGSTCASLISLDPIKLIAFAPRRI